MGAGDLVQKGTTVVVGFNSRTVGTWIMQDSGESPGADIKEIRGPQNSVLTKLITNPHKTYKATGVLLSADLTTMAGAKIGDLVSINSVNCMLLSLDISFGAEDARATLTAVKEDSMTYS
jgi:hypothetical protein